MKILHVITSLRTGGAEHLMVDLLPELRSLGDEVELLVFDGTRTPFMDELESTGVKVQSLSVGRNVYSPLNIFGLCKFVNKFDIVHTHNTACQLFAPLAKCLNFGGAKLVTTEHNATNRRRDKKFLKWVDHWMYSKYLRIICISDQTKSNLVKYLGRNSKIKTIYNGISIKRFLLPIKQIKEKQRLIVTMIAAFRTQKDQDTLIKAVAELPANYRVRLVGDGARRDELQRLAVAFQVADRVDFLGIRSDIPKLLAESDINVLSSHWEGLSLSSIEGMASGRPFVASDVDGLREIVGGNGVLFPEGDARKLAHEIRSLCENPEHYREVAIKCQEKAKQYDISVMARRYHELYLSL